MTQTLFYVPISKNTSRFILSPDLNPYDFRNNIFNLPFYCISPFFLNGNSLHITIDVSNPDT
jgi:hypothetical protein